MYPFERFTEDAKRVLTLAQEEAERSHHSYIGTEHLLLGIMRGKGTGHDALVELGIDAGRVRAVIASVLGRNERIIDPKPQKVSGEWRPAASPTSSTRSEGAEGVGRRRV